MKHDICPPCTLKFPAVSAYWSSQVNILLLEALSVIITNILYAMSYLWRTVSRTQAKLMPEYIPVSSSKPSKTS